MRGRGSGCYTAVEAAILTGYRGEGKMGGGRACMTTQGGAKNGLHGSTGVKNGLHCRQDQGLGQGPGTIA